MTLRERRFADFYIECGVATEAAKKAGYSPRTAKQIGHRLLQMPDVKIYISARLEEIETRKLADVQEVLEFYSAVLRGEIKDQFGLEASIQDRLKAADALMKRFLVADDRNSNTLAKLDGLLAVFKNAIAED